MMNKKLDSLKNVVDSKLCMGCGFCSVKIQEGTVKKNQDLIFNEKLDIFAPSLDKQHENKLVNLVCPGAKMDLVELAKAKYNKLPDDEIVGEVIKIRAGYSGDEAIREKGASGGIIPSVLKYLFQEKKIDVAYCVDSSTNPNENKGRLIYSESDLGIVHGSVYHPAQFGDGLVSLLQSGLRFAYVGLPCEIAALEQLKLKMPEIKNKHILSIGLFCGGINTFKGIEYYLNGFNIQWKDVHHVDYRHGGWPGNIKVKLDSDDRTASVIPRIKGNSRWKILRYVIAFQGYWMLKRCRLCPDQISDFADIAVGDPHLPRFKKQDKGYSAIVTRSLVGEEVISTMLSKDYLVEASLSRDELVKSQGYTLDNRRHIYAYKRVCKLFNITPPEITTYPGLEKSASLRHYVYAFVDLMKVSIPKIKLIRAFYYPWQIFEYLFLTFTPNLFFRRLNELIFNRKKGG